MALLKFDNVTVAYPIYNAKSMSLRNQLIRLSTGGRLSKEANHTVTVTALNQVTFELHDGDAVGLIGHNGAGKTTLLRTMAGIYTPISGTVTRQGSLASIIELGAGMEQELSGYENIRRMGLFLGLSLDESEQKIPEIETFTELGGYLHLPVRTYSSGMLMRLMFAVGTSIRPEILLIDEMFSTGDAEFQKKAESRIHNLIDAAKIFVFASHSLDLIKQYCKRVFKLDSGSVVEEL